MGSCLSEAWQRNWPLLTRGLLAQRELNKFALSCVNTGRTNRASPSNLLTSKRGIPGLVQDSPEIRPSATLVDGQVINDCKASVLSGRCPPFLLHRCRCAD